MAQAPISNSEPVVHHNPSAARFEIVFGAEIAVLEYRVAGRQIIFTHTGVPAVLEGRGIGSRLARAGLDHARALGLQVVPLCSFIAGYIQKHPEYAPLLTQET